MNNDNDVYYHLDVNTVDDIKDNIQKIELLRRKSYHCLNRQQRKQIDDLYNDVGKGAGKKLILVMFSSLIAYYGLFTLIIPELIYQLGIDERIVYFIVVTIITMVIISLFWYIHKGDFGKTQFFIYLFTYTLFSMIGLMIFFSTNFPITSYQIINTFLYILIVQVAIMSLSLYFTRVLVCRI